MFGNAMKHAEKLAEKLKNSNDVHIVTHIDADGISAGAIAKKALERQEWKAASSSSDSLIAKPSKK